MKPEDRFVEKLQSLIPAVDRVLVGPGDDAAVISTGGGNLVVTTDMIVEAVDFLPGEEPERIGRRAFAVNLSDLAAMGARPEFFLLSIAFPPEKGETFPLAVVRGALSRAKPLGAALVGGDVSSAPTILVSAVLCGRPEGSPICRSGGRPGDLLFLSGSPGRAAAGLRLAKRLLTFASQGSRPTPRFVGLSPEHERELLSAYHDPEPRLTLGLALAREAIAHAAIDVSDGLGIDAARLARASGVRAVLERERIPVSPAVASFTELEATDLVEWILAGGDDYELLFAAPESALLSIERLGRDLGHAVTRIGHLEAGEGAVLRDRHGDRDIAALGHDHWEPRR